MSVLAEELECETAVTSIQTRFGMVEYRAENILSFPEGLIGFKELREFIVLPNESNGPLFWIQSVEDPDVAFILTDPSCFFPKYGVEPESHERKVLGMRKGENAFVLVIVKVDESQKITFNLQAPILFSPHSNRALQVILEKSTFSVRETLPELKK